VSGIIATVFGGTGFLGRHVIQDLGRIGSQIIVPFRGEEMKYMHLKPMADLGQLVPVKMDSIYDVPTLELSMARSNVVVNLIGRRWGNSNFSVHEANAETARITSKFAARAGITHFIHVSTIGASEKSKSDWLKAKWESEQFVKQNIPTATIVRTAPVFGHEDRLLARLGFWLQRSKWVPNLCPNHRSQPISGEDFADGVVQLVANPGVAAGKTYTFAGPKVWTNEELLEFAQEITIRPFNRKEPDWLSRIKFRIEGPLSKQNVITPDEEVMMEEVDLVMPEGNPALQNSVQSLGIKPKCIQDEAIEYLRGYRTAAMQQVERGVKF